MDCLVCKSPFGVASHNDCAEAMTAEIARLAREKAAAEERADALLDEADIWRRNLEHAQADNAANAEEAAALRESNAILSRTILAWDEELATLRAQLAAVREVAEQHLDATAADGPVQTGTWIALQETLALTPADAGAKAPKHVCGLRGFPESGDRCPACVAALEGGS